MMGVYGSTVYICLSNSQELLEKMHLGQLTHAGRKLGSIILPVLRCPTGTTKKCFWQRQKVLPISPCPDYVTLPCGLSQQVLNIHCKDVLAAGLL